MTGALPTGWPVEVRPPDSPDWERSAVAWLYDLCPPDYRGYDVLRRHPVVLARLAAAHVGAARDAVRHGLGTARADLRGLVPPGVVDEAVAVYEREGDRLAATARAVDLVAAALAGTRFRPKL